MALSKYLADAAGNPIDNQSTQDLIAQKINAGGIKLEDGTILNSQSGVKAEVAKMLKMSYASKGLKPDDRLIDFLVYGIDKPE